MEEIPYEWIFAGQVREIQDAFPIAHKALKQWGIWSRQRGGIFPRLAPPSLWDMAKPGDANDWVEADDIGLPIVEQREIKAEAVGDEPCDEKMGEALDVMLHALEFPVVWRRCLSAAYVSRETPEYQFPREATLARPRESRISHDNFLQFLDGALQFIEGKLVGQDAE